jgi:hypothetical protein
MALPVKSGVSAETADDGCSSRLSDVFSKGLVHPGALKRPDRSGLFGDFRLLNQSRVFWILE